MWPRRVDFRLRPFSHRLEQRPASQVHRASDQAAHRGNRQETWLSARNVDGAVPAQPSASHSVGVLFFDITDPFCTLIMRGVWEKRAVTKPRTWRFSPTRTTRKNRFERYLELFVRPAMSKG